MTNQKITLRRHHCQIFVSCLSFILEVTAVIFGFLLYSWILFGVDVVLLVILPFYDLSIKFESNLITRFN